MILILHLKLDWTHFRLNVRRNIRNSLIKCNDEGWIVLARPECDEDRALGDFGDFSEVIPSDIDSGTVLDLSDSKEELFDANDIDGDSYSFSYNQGFDRLATAVPEILHARLPTGKSEVRLVRKYFHKIHDSAGRIKETFFNLH